MELSHSSPWKFWTGIVLVVLAILVPSVATAESFGVVETIQRGLDHYSQVKLLEGVFRLVALNALYGYPRYLGAFFISAFVVVSFRGRKILWVNMGIAIAIAGFINVFNGSFYGSQRISALPLLAIPVLQMLLWSLDYPHVSLLRRMPVMMCVLTGFQFINLMPALEHLSLGRDLTAVYVKAVMVSEGLRHTMNITMLACASICFATGGLLLTLLHNENRLLQINQLKAENSEILMNARLKELQSRSNWELKHLVHDLKTPLTTIQTLAYVVKLNQREDQGESIHYLERIEGSVEHMSNMISQILYEDHRRLITTSALLDIALAQLSATSYASAIQSTNQIPDELVEINGIRMVRAIINLVENSSHSKSDRPLSIQITAALEEDMVAISVADNGIGIPKEQLDVIWNRGHSTQGSSGLGLSYVQETVTQCNGLVRIQSEVDVGTQITILLPRGETPHE